MKSLAKNKKAFFTYTILEKYLAGIQLQGSEVKSIKASKVSIVEAYCYITNGEIFIKGMHVTEHKQGGKYNNPNYLTNQTRLPSTIFQRLPVLPIERLAFSSSDILTPLLGGIRPMEALATFCLVSSERCFPFQ